MARNKNKTFRRKKSGLRKTQGGRLFGFIKGKINNLMKSNKTNVDVDSSKIYDIKIPDEIDKGIIDNMIKRQDAENKYHIYALDYPFWTSLGKLDNELLKKFITELKAAKVAYNDAKYKAEKKEENLSKVEKAFFEKFPEIAKQINNYKKIGDDIMKSRMCGSNKN